MPAPNDDRVLVDFRTADDAGVYRWAAGPALVQTVDFFTPIVDDPYVYGQVAAANALSDVYAMGGRPLTALAIAAFPADLPHETVRAIFQGGFDKLREAGVALLGGHTVQDREIKFGYAVTGEVDPARVWSNAGARPGDEVWLTKPVGTGIVTTAIKNQRAPRAAADAVVASMVALNGPAAEAFRDAAGESVHAVTDVTGFGLLGHAAELARASGVSLRLEAGRVPVFEGALELALENTPGGGWSNEEHFKAGLRFKAELAAPLVRVLYDPQTSGGLLAAIAPGAAGAVARALPRAVRIGRVAPPEDAWLVVEP
jgi:selenide,water dikinase